jgi:nitroreductase
MPILKTIRERRSIREFTGKDPPSATLLRLIDALRWAPSAGNLQSRHFYFVCDTSRRKALARAASQPFLSQAPVIVVACANHRIRSEYGERGVKLYCLMDVAAALQNLLLVAHEAGLGTCWVGAFDERRVRALLEIPRYLRPVSLVPLGYPAESPEPPERDERNDVAVFVR